MSINEFLHMGGYAPYVWWSYGISLVVLVANVLLPWLQRRRLLTDLQQRARREARMKK